MPASRWGVFLLNNHAESKENWEKWVLFSVIPQRQSTVFFFFFPAVCLVVGHGCYRDYEFCQADKG